MTTTTDSSTTATQPDPVSDNPSTARDIPRHPRTEDEPSAATPLEMSSLPSKSVSSDQNASDVSPPVVKTSSAESSAHPLGPQRIDTNTAIDQSLHPQAPPSPVDGAVVTRTFTGAIGPSSDSPLVPAKDSETSGPVLQITLLLTSGARHPFKLDSKYLSKRNVEIPGNDPFNLSVYKLKELILREWRDEWEAKPSSPNYIRLISFGKLLDDKAPLKDYKFTADATNVLHMTIKPQDFVEDEDAKGGKSTFANNREAEGRSPGCRCVIM